MTAITYGPVGTLPTRTTTTAPSASAVSSTSGASTSGASSKDPTAVDRDLFLKLLVAQLKYQDPSSPTDPSQFLSQTAQFSTVEKLNQLATLSQQVYDASRQQTAASLMGRAVTWTDVSGKAHSGTVTGVSVGASTPNLSVDGTIVSLDSVTAVGTMAQPATGSTG
jgi:flagellar basal-body rod modification protein FlgD